MAHLSYVLDERDLVFEAIRAQGAGGQNVNKVASAVQLRFDIRASSLPERVKERLLARPDRRITETGVVVIKAQTHRTQDRNRAEAITRLRELIAAAAFVPRARIETKPTRASQRRRVEGKLARGEIKQGRGRVRED